MDVQEIPEDEFLEQAGRSGVRPRADVRRRPSSTCVTGGSGYPPRSGLRVRGDMKVHRPLPRARA
ncbi:MAG: hypothetical protein M0C28_48590 [Candidatus Moduliflexus flocculans]|nr:hypothetical protein [Candidatus Moduliflexus flocculans]